MPVVALGLPFVALLETAAQADSKNLGLQFLLTERYRKDGQNEKADALLRELLKNQGEPQVYAALAQSYFKEKKVEELLKTLGEAIQKPGGVNAVKGTLDALGDDPEQAEKALDAGLKMLEATPSTLSKDARKVLEYVAGRAKKLDKLIVLDRAALKTAPIAANYRVLCFDLFKAAKFDESAAAIDELLAKNPAEKNAPTFVLLARARFFAGKVPAALEAAHEARRLEPNDHETLEFLGILLGQAGRDDEAIALYEDILKRFANDEDAVKRARSGLST